MGSVIWVALGGAVGAVGRYGISLLPWKGAFPLLTLATNFLGAVSYTHLYFREKLEAMPQVEYVRGRGLMLGVKLKEKDAHDVLTACAKEGLLILTAKELVRFLPPLTIAKEDMDQGLAIFQRVLEQETQ